MKREPILFEEFWSCYPRKVGRIKAQKIWRSFSFSEQAAVLVGLCLWKQTQQWQTGDGQYIPYASTFLAQKRYLDEPWAGAFEERVDSQVGLWEGYKR